MVSLWQSFLQFLRANFIAGLFIAAPLGITLAVLAWVWGKINEPLAYVFNAATGPQEGVPLLRIIRNSEYSQLAVPLLGLLLLVSAVVLLGMAARSIIGRVILNIFEAAMARVPVVGVLYTSVKQLGKAFISEDGKSKFQRAVAVQFPYKGCWAIAFVTGNGDAIMANAQRERASDVAMLTLFVPMSPMPTGGFTIVVPASETMELNISVQDALKLVCSGGMIGAGTGESQKITRGRGIPTLATASASANTGSPSNGANPSPASPQSSRESRRVPAGTTGLSKAVGSD